jgi:hypothetical protein
MGEIVTIKQHQVDYPKWLNLELWQMYIEKRIEIKKPLTERAERMAIRKLGMMIDEGLYTQEEIMVHNLSEEWQGLFMPNWKK